MFFGCRLRSKKKKQVKLRCMNLPTTLLVELQYLPSVSYFAQFTQYQSIIIEQHEHYQKGGYRNRCDIAGANGVLRLSIPLQKGKNERQLITEVKIADDAHWQRQHWQSIRSAYGRAPFFEYYSDFFEPLFQKKYIYLFDFNKDLFLLLIKLLKLKTPIGFSEMYDKTTALPHSIVDGRNQSFANDTEKRYSQLFEDRHGFLSNLSVLDLLFCCGPEARRVIEKISPKFSVN